MADNLLEKNMSLSLVAGAIKLSKVITNGKARFFSFSNITEGASKNVYNLADLVSISPIFYELLLHQIPFTKKLKPKL